MKRLKNDTLFMNCFKVLLTGVITLFFSSCNKEIENKISFTDSNEVEKQYSEKSYRVAYIVIDGAVGTVVGSEATDFNSMPYLSELTQKSLFSWNSIAAENSDDISYYADLLTGVGQAKHKVTSDDLSTANLTKYPLIFDRIKSSTNLKTAVIANSNNGNIDKLTSSSSIDNKKLYNSDVQVVEEAKKELTSADTYFTLITLNNVDKVGKESGYGNSNALYLQALKTVDGQIKEIIQTIESRDTYSSEKWLVVITSNRGGEYELDPALDDGSLYADTKRNNFVLFYNKDFKYKIIQKTDLSDPVYEGAALRYTGTATKASLEAQAAESFNMGNTADKEYTVQLKIKVHKLGTNNPAIISKMNNTGNSENGWSFIYNGQLGWRFKIYGTQVIDADAFNLNQWYTLTTTVYNDNGTRKAKVFRDGVLKATGTIGGAQGSSASPLNIGYSAAWGSDSDHTIADIRIFNTALPDDYVAANYCSTAIYDDNPYWDNLLGYWPALDGSGSELLDYSKNKKNLMVTGGIAWNSFSDRQGTLCPTAPQRMDLTTIRSMDAPLLIYSWLGLLGVEKFDLDSKVWSLNYSNN